MFYEVAGMVKLENINRVDNVISVDCYAEGKEYFYLEIDATSFEIIVNSINEMDAYVFHAIQKIKELILSGRKLPSHTMSMWC